MSLVVDNLPSDFIQKMAGHALNQEIEQRKFANAQPAPVDRVIKGEVFEQLVEIERSTKGLGLLNAKQESDGKVNVEMSEDQKLVGELLAELMHNPQRFGIDIHRKRNPDMFSIIFREGKWQIVSCLEVKTRVDKRSLDQLGNGGFRQRIEDFLKNTDPEILNRKGLEELYEVRPAITFSEDYIQTVVVPNSETPDDIHSGFYEPNIPHDKRKELHSLLNDPKKINILFSSFNRRDVGEITEIVTRKVREVVEGTKFGNQVKLV